MTTLEEKKFVSLSLLCKSLQIEIEVLQELDESYGIQFAKDFTKENQFTIDNQDDQRSADDNHNESPGENHDLKEKNEFHSAVKKLHRALARETHPDLTGESAEFRKIQSAYEEGDIIYLVSTAQDKNIKADLDMEDLTFLEKNINSQREKFDDIKKTVRWAWAESDKSDGMRRQIQTSLGIDPALFKEWLATQIDHVQDSN